MTSSSVNVLLVERLASRNGDMTLSERWQGDDTPFPRTASTSNTQKKKRGSRTTTRQFELMVQFMADHPAFAAGQYHGTEGKKNAERLWERLAFLLNKDPIGPEKSAARWISVWTNWKCSVRSKALKLKTLSKGMRGFTQTDIKLTDVEKKLMALLGPTEVSGDELEESNEKTEVTPEVFIVDNEETEDITIPEVILGENQDTEATDTHYITPSQLYVLRRSVAPSARISPQSKTPASPVFLGKRPATRPGLFKKERGKVLKRTAHNAGFTDGDGSSSSRHGETFESFVNNHGSNVDKIATTLKGIDQSLAAIAKAETSKAATFAGFLQLATQVFNHFVQNGRDQ